VSRPLRLTPRERIVTASGDRTARIWSGRTGEPIGKPLQHAGGVRAAAFDPTGERIVTASDDNTARIWNGRTGEPIGKPLQHADIVWAAAFDPKGERVVTASFDNTARIWDARTGEPIGKPLQHADIVWAAAFDPKGERVVTASDDNTARIWRAPPTGQALAEEVRAVLGPRAPEPLKLPENANRQESYGALMALGAQTLLARAQSLFQPN
jgi:WD40 repeat protein